MRKFLVVFVAVCCLALGFSVFSNPAYAKAEKYTVAVQYSEPLLEAVAAVYQWTGFNTIFNNLFLSLKKEQYIRIVMFETVYIFGYASDAFQLQTDLRKRGLRPASIPEVKAFRNAYGIDDEQPKNVIVYACDVPSLLGNYYNEPCRCEVGSVFMYCLDESVGELLQKEEEAYLVVRE